MSSDKQARKIKAVVVGDSDVGKTNLCQRIVHHRFAPAMRSTHEFEKGELWIEMRGALARVELWDTAGQERYHSLTDLFFRNAEVCIVVYDVTNRASFEHTNWWFGELKRVAPPAIGNVGLRKQPNIILVGNKKDDEHLREVGTREGFERALSWGETVLFCEESAIDSQHDLRLKVALAIAAERIQALKPMNTMYTIWSQTPTNTSDTRLSDESAITTIKLGSAVDRPVHTTEKEKCCT